MDGGTTSRQNFGTDVNLISTSMKSMSEFRTPSQDTNSTGNQDMKTAKVAQGAEFTFDVDGTGTDGREGLEDKSSSETSGRSFELASNNANIGKMSPSCEQI